MRTTGEVFGMDRSLLQRWLGPLTLPLILSLILAAAAILCLATTTSAAAAQELDPVDALESPTDDEEIFIEPRVIGGTAVPQGTFSFSSRLIALPFGCGSTLVAPEWLMTAAHCLEHDPALSDVYAIIDRATITDNTSGIIRDAREIIVHPDFDSTNYSADIALIRIDPVTSVTPVTLGTDALDSLWTGGTTATVAGWGRTTPSGTGVDTLRSAQVPVLSDSACLQTRVGPRLDPAVHICAGTSVTDACNGDSGGPLFVTRPNGQHIQFGIVSWGVECAGVNAAGVYTEVAAFEDWWRPIIFPAATPQLNTTVTCVNSNGLVAANVTNPGSTAALITVFFGTLRRTVSVGAQQTERVAVSGRPDGSLTITATAGGGGSTTDTVFVDCDPNIEVQSSASCLAGNGLVTVVVTNITNNRRVYRVSVDGLSARSYALDPQQAAIVRVSGRPDGQIPVNVMRSSFALPTQAVTVDCDPNPTRQVTIGVSCLAGNGRIDVVLANLSAATSTYSVTVGTVAPRTATLASGAVKTVTVTGRQDGGLTIRVRRNGAVITSTTRTVDCD